MRCYVLALLLVCGIPAQGNAFTLQSFARVNIVPALEIRQIHAPDRTPGNHLATATWGSGSEASITFAISGPPDLWASISLVDLATHTPSPDISPVEDSSGELKVTFPLPDAFDAGKNPRRSLLLRVEYE